MTNKTFELKTEIKGNKTIFELAVLIFGEKLEMRNKSLKHKLENMPCEYFIQKHGDGEKDYSFVGTNNQKVQGIEFKFHVYSKLIKKTGKYTLISSH